MLAGRLLIGTRVRADLLVDVLVTKGALALLLEHEEQLPAVAVLELNATERHAEIQVPLGIDVNVEVIDDDEGAVAHSELDDAEPAPSERLAEPCGGARSTSWSS